MFNVLTENLLNLYFFARAAAGDHADRAELLKKLCSAYLCDGLYSKLEKLSQSPDLGGIDSLESYNRFKRVLSYKRITGADETVSPEVLSLINVKGGALKAARRYEIDNPAWLSASAVYDMLLKRAEAGICEVITLLGFLRCEGIFVRKDFDGGLKMLSRAACWNDPAAIILSLKYDAENRGRNLNRLYTVWRGAQYGRVIEDFSAAYGLTPETDENAVLVGKAIRRGVLKSEVVDFKYSRVINSNVLGFGERQDLVLGGRKELVYEIANLPLTSGGREGLFCGAAELSFLGKRAQAEINAALKGSDLRRHGDYKPLCICSGERLVNELCAEAIEGALYGDCNVIRISAGDVTSGWELTRDNAVLRGVSDKKPNVVFFHMYGALNAAAYEGIEQFLRTDLRAAIRVNLGVSLDLSDILPVCFCDAKNAAALEKLCRVTELERLGKTARAEVLKKLLESKARQYGFGISLAPEAKKAVLGLGADECAEVVNKAFVKAYSGGNCKFGGDEIGEIIRETSGKLPTIGFGGAHV